MSIKQCPRCGYQLLPGETECPRCKGAGASTPSTSPGPPRTSGLAIAALVVGILALCGGILALPGLILGIASLVQVNRSEGRLGGRGMAWSAIGLSMVGIVVFGFFTMGAILYPVFMRAREAARKATCLSNLKQIAQAALMYAQDHDGALPVCVASDSQGTGHAVAGLYANRTRDDFVRDVRSKYGAEYVDGRWMWQLADALAPYVKEKGPELFNCPTLVRQNASFRMETYVVGTDKRTGKADPHDPLRAYLPGKRRQKVWQSGSYVYMCAHYPYRRAVKAADYGADYASQPGIPIFMFWDLAKRTGVVGQAGAPDAANPEDYLACGNRLDSFADPAREPLLMCDSLGVHEGYGPDYIRNHVLPPDLGGAAPTIPASTPVAFADGHAEYYRLSFPEMLRLMFQNNSRGALGTPSGASRKATP
jgi:hypothetical protein